jgi:drug/metabolite transporter (DMT)-like permease
MMSLELPALAALFSACTWGLGSLLFRRILADPDPQRRPGAASACMIKNLAACTAFVGVWVIVGGAPPDTGAITWLAWSGLIGFAIGDALYFGAVARCGVQVTGVVAQLNVPTAALMAWAFMGEELSYQELGSMALVLGGATLVILDDPKQSTGTIGRKRHGIYCALVCAVCQGVGIVMGHGGMEGVGVVPGTVVRLAAGVMGAFVLSMLFDLGAGVAKKKGGQTAALVHPFRRPEMLKRLLFAALIASVINLLPYHFAVRELRGGISAVLFATAPLFTLPLGPLFGERHGWRAVCGTLLGFFGVAGILTAG